MQTQVACPPQLQVGNRQGKALQVFRRLYAVALRGAHPWCALSSPSTTCDAHRDAPGANTAAAWPLHRERTRVAAAV